MSREGEAISIRHCERSDAIHLYAGSDGLLRCARNDVEEAAAYWMPCLRGDDGFLRGTPFVIIQSLVAIHLSSKGTINPSSRCAHLELKSRRWIRQIIFCWSSGDCNGDDLFSTHEEPTDRLDSRSRTKDKVRDGEEIAWVNFLAR